MNHHSIIIPSILLLIFVSSTIFLFNDHNNDNDWTPNGGQRKLLSSNDDLASDLRDDFHGLYRENDNNRFCSFYQTGNDTTTQQPTYDCDWKAYMKNLVYICIPGAVVAFLLSTFCCSFAILRKCNLCGSDLPSNGCLFTDTYNVQEYSTCSITCFKIVFILSLLITVGITPLAWYGNQQMIKGTNDSGDDAVSAAEDVNDLALLVQEQALLVPGLSSDPDTMSLITDAVDYSENFLDDSKTFRDNMKMVNFWRNIVLCVTLALLILICFLAFWATWTNSPGCVKFSKGWLIFFISILCFLLLVTTATSVVTSDFCWEVDYALQSPENIRSSYIGILMDCNSEDYPFADLMADLLSYERQYTVQLCQGWAKYCSSFPGEVTCDTINFDCQNDLTSSNDIYSRTIILEGGSIYNISSCASSCSAGSQLQQSSASLNTYLIGYDELNLIIIEITPYMSCDWIYLTLDSIVNPTCVDAVIGGGYLSIALVFLALLCFFTAGLGFMAAKRYDIRNHEYTRGDYVPAL